MKFIEHTANGNKEVIVKWGDHWPACEHCRTVDIDRSATFANACAQGSPLLMEELANRQAPVVRQKSAENKEWAKKAGTFVVDKANKEAVTNVTKYK